MALHVKGIIHGKARPSLLHLRQSESSSLPMHNLCARGAAVIITFHQHYATILHNFFHSTGGQLQQNQWQHAAQARAHQTTPWIRLFVSLVFCKHKRWLPVRFETSSGSPPALFVSEFKTALFARPRVYLRCRSVYGKTALASLNEKQLIEVSFDVNELFVCTFDVLEHSRFSWPNFFVADAAGRAIQSIAEAACTVRRR